MGLSSLGRGLSASPGRGRFLSGVSGRGLGGEGLIKYEPTLYLDFLHRGPLHSAITFTRGSSGTYFNQKGVLVSAATNVARFDYNPLTLQPRGLLIEGARTNLCLQSEDIATTWTNSNSTESVNAIAAPDGATTADKIEENTANTAHGMLQTITYTNVVHTFSAFLKAAERTWGVLRIFDGTTSWRGWFNLSTGVVGTVDANTTSTITNVGGGWYLCTITATTPAAAAGNLFVGASTADGTFSYAGTTGSGIYCWGMQLEAAAFASSYIATTTASVARSADVVSVGTLTPWLNATEGTLLAEASVIVLHPSDNRPLAEFHDTTNNERISLLVLNTSSSSVSRGQMRDDGSTVVAIDDAVSWVANTPRRIAFAYKANDFAMSAGGGAAGTDTSGGVATVTTLQLGANFNGAGAGAGNLFGHVRRVAYWPRRLPDSMLQALSA